MPADAQASNDAGLATRRLASLRAAFPARSLNVAPPGPGWRNGPFWGAVLAIVAGGAMCAAYLPLLITDLPLALSGKAVPMAEYYLGPGSACTAWARVVTDCDLHLRARTPDGLWHSRSISFIHFFGRPASLRDFQVLGLPAEPYWLTVDGALDRFGNRLLTAGVFIGGAVVLAVRLARGALEAWRIPRRIKAALSGRVLSLVLLRTDQLRAGAPGGIRWSNPHGRALFPLARPRRGPPTMLLGVAAADTACVMPLDLALTWIDLTDEERLRLQRVAAAWLVGRGQA